MEKRARHRPRRRYPDAERQIFECELDKCPKCEGELEMRPNWHMRKTIQTLDGPRFVAGKSKVCKQCRKRYYASQVLLLSLPQSTYGLDVLAYIGWQHEHEHKQLVEIQRELNKRGIEVNERNVGKLYRQFLALLGASREPIMRRLKAGVEEHGGLIFGLDALQPEGHGSLLYVLYEVLSKTVVAAIQLEQATELKLTEWLRMYQAYPALATLSDGEEGIIAAMQSVWPDAPHQRCQEHFLGNLAEDVEQHDALLRKQMREDLGGLPKASEISDIAPFLPTRAENEPVKQN